MSDIPGSLKYSHRTFTAASQPCALSISSLRPAELSLAGVELVPDCLFGIDFPFPRGPGIARQRIDIVECWCNQKSSRLLW